MDEPIINSESKPKIKTFHYVADLIKWGVQLVGCIVDYIKENPIPKRGSYER